MNPISPHNHWFSCLFRAATTTTKTTSSSFSFSASARDLFIRHTQRALGNLLVVGEEGAPPIPPLLRLPALPAPPKNATGAALGRATIMGHRVVVLLAEPLNRPIPCPLPILRSR